MRIKTGCISDRTPTPDSDGSLSNWQPNTTIAVHVNSNSGHFTQNEFDNCVKPVFDSFNNANSDTYSGNKNYSKINFNVSFSSTVVATVDPITDESVNEPGITRGFQLNKDSNLARAAETHRGNNTTNLNSATSLFNSQITNCTALKQTVAHEVGHTMGLSHYCGLDAYPCPKYFDYFGESVMNLAAPEDLNNTTWGRETPADCDNEVIACKVSNKCKNTRNLSISGSFPQIVGYSSKITYHQMTIANYNDSTGTFEIKFTDYDTNKTSPSATPTYSSASIPAYAVVKNSDPCIHVNGQVINITPSYSTPPTFNCALTKIISLTYNRTENVTPPGSSNSYTFVKVYTGQTTPGTGAPYMHFIPYSAYNNQYAYAYNVYY